MVVDADRSAAFRFQEVRGVIELLEGLGQRGFLFQGSAELILSHAIDIEHSAEPDRLFADSHVVAFIQIDRDAEMPQRAKCLGSPGAAGLAITAWRGAEKSGEHLPRPLFRGARNSAAPSSHPHAAQIERRSGLDAVEIGVVADIVMAQRANHIGTPARFQHARFLAYHLNVARTPNLSSSLAMRSAASSAAGSM